jgi:cytosine/adenosine deaminase-related metal-dependent hydrolase
MSEPRIRSLPTEVQLALEVMPCQAMRRVYEPGVTPHPCAYFGEWGFYHTYDYPAEGPPATPGIEQPAIYRGKAALVPEILSGCRKAPLMAVGINPNLPGFWPNTRNAVNPLFEDFLQYAHYFRYRSIAKLQIPRDTYDELRGDREDSPTDREPLTEEGETIPVEPAPLTMYRAYQSLLDGLAEQRGWADHRLTVGEDLSYANMVACPSARWVVNAGAGTGGMPVMGFQRMRGIVRECFHERRYFLRQLFQSLPAVLLVFSETTGREFIRAMAGKFSMGEPQPDEDLDELLEREIRLRFGTTSSGEELSARVVFLPHASANPQAFDQFRGAVIDILAEEVEAGRLVYDPATRHLRRPQGGCVFCSNTLYRIGPCDYEAELRPLAPEGGPGLLADDMDVGVLEENSEQERLLEAFLAPRAPAVAGAELFNVDPPTGPAFVLRGRLVTMDAARRVIPDGRLYVRQGGIVAVAGPGEPAPAGFGSAPVVDTGGTIYPGLLDLHNHLPYNIATLWKVPKVYPNRDVWRNDPDYIRKVREPLGPLVNDPATARAIVRYVEVKALLGGTTSVQGMRLASGSAPVYEGVVRNFERTDDDRLPEARTQLDNLRAADLPGFRRKLEERLAVFYHLSEGVDPGTRRHYEYLVENDLLQAPLVGIHALALRKADLAAMAEGGCKVVWSPMSNLLLYGKTLNPRWLRETGIPFAVGCDWSPTGGKNPLEELKVAWLVAQAQNAGLNQADLCAAVTRGAAEVVGWGEVLGSLAAGKYADLLVLAGADADPYQALIDATERDVRLVAIAGWPRCGDAEVMGTFTLPGGPLESIIVGGREKRLYLHHPTGPLGALTLKDAVTQLQAAMANIPQVEAAAAGAAFLLDDADDFRLVLDNDYDELAASGPTLADVMPLLQSIPLDPLTVVDDPGYFDRLESIAHLPDVLRGLQAFYP